MKFEFPYPLSAPGGSYQFGDGTVGAPSISFSADTNTGLFRPAADVIAFATGGTEGMRLNASQRLLLGTTTDSANGRIQLATHTTSAGGIGFGTDVTVYRQAANQLALSAVGGFYLIGTGATFYFNTSAAYIGISGSSLNLGSGSATALSLDGSQNATFAGQLRVTNPVTPASAAATGTVGTMAWDSSYLYVCIAANTWRRVAHATW